MPQDSAHTLLLLGCLALRGCGSDGCRQVFLVLRLTLLKPQNFATVVSSLQVWCECKCIGLSVLYSYDKNIALNGFLFLENAEISEHSASESFV